MKFGQRAKQIKNQAKVNKELSVKELKHLLKLAENEILLKNKKIATLEDYIVKLEATLEGSSPEDRVSIKLAKVELQNQKAQIANALLAATQMEM